MFTNENKFVVFLSSNSTPTSPLEVGNQPGYFYNILPEKIYLSNDYEVSLAEISFNKTWNNINKFQTIGIEVFNVEIFDYSDILIEPGYYQTIEELLYTLNTALKSIQSIDNFKINKYPKFLINPINKKIVIESGSVINLNSGISSICIPKLPKQLCKILGFYIDNVDLNIETYDLFNPIYNISKRENKFVLTSIEGFHDFDLSSINWINVYCDIIKPSIVGNSLENVFGKIKIEKNIKFGDKIVIKFENPSYYSLNHFEFDYILIYLRDEKGQYINFNNSSVTNLTLKFRKKFNVYKSLLKLLY